MPSLKSAVSRASRVGFHCMSDRRIEPGLILRCQQALGRRQRLRTVCDQHLRQRAHTARLILRRDYLIDQPKRCASAHRRACRSAAGREPACRQSAGPETQTQSRAQSRSAPRCSQTSQPAQPVKSQMVASPVPPAIAAPCTAAMVGLGSSYNVRNSLAIRSASARWSAADLSHALQSR
jgi:hypothetical protein